MSSTSRNDLERVVCLIDMDCFYVQVEEVAAPEFRGKPCGVSQYNPYKGGGLIAVNYEARKFGVKRGMRGEEAKALCPDFHIFFVQEKRGKADLSKYRDASAKIFEILGKNFKNVEKASIDEAYIDLTDLAVETENSSLNVELCDSFVVGKYTTLTTDDNKIDQEANLNAWLDTVNNRTRETTAVSNDRLLAVGAWIVQRVRKEIFDTLGFHCSAGLAHNKTLAKFCAGINKPNRQTILPLVGVQDLYERTPINKIKNLGGKLGIMLTEGLNLNTMSDLAKKSLSELISIFGDKTGNWLHQISKGIDTEPVMSRRAAKSIGCSKNFRGNQVLNTHTKLEYWVRNLCEELEERLESDKAMNHRDASLLVVHIANEAGSFSKSSALVNAGGSYCSKRLTAQTMDMLQGFNKSKIKDQWHPVIYGLGLSATKFVSKEKPANSIVKYFSNAQANNTNKSKSNGESKSRTSSNENPIDLGTDSDYYDEEMENVQEKNIVEVVKNDDEKSGADKNDGNKKETSAVTEKEDTSKSVKNKLDIKSMLMKQAEKAAVAVVNKTSPPENKKTAAPKEKKPDLKTMLLKQAEKAVVAPVVLINANSNSSNKENEKKPAEVSKPDLKNMLMKQAEKAVKVRPPRELPSKMMIKPNEANTTPKQQRSSPPCIITLGDSPEEDDYAQVRASLTAFAEKSAKKLQLQEKSTTTPSVKRRSIDLTPLKTKSKSKAKKPKTTN